MHTEYYRVTDEAANIINSAKAEGNRIICVGTTSCRTVESASVNGLVQAGEGNTDIFIYPVYQFHQLSEFKFSFAGIHTFDVSIRTGREGKYYGGI